MCFRVTALEDTFLSALLNCSLVNFSRITPTAFLRLLQCFSLSHNMSRLAAPDRNGFEYLNGIRVLSLFW
jgi:hypothetical protein